MLYDSVYRFYAMTGALDITVSMAPLVAFLFIVNSVSDFNKCKVSRMWLHKEGRHILIKFHEPRIGSMPDLVYKVPIRNMRKFLGD